ncbi:hypothetical protein ATANTOWER_022237, partial [Ataeniobius toweri]|nr:hypothetical protein [Ataeniobius toweri]
ATKPSISGQGSSRPRTHDRDRQREDSSRQPTGYHCHQRHDTHLIPVQFCTSKFVKEHW